MLLRCPRCGGAGILQHWFKMMESCPTCGLALERGEAHDYWLGAYAINLVVARILLRAGRRHQSITLEADAHHLMSDVWTSVGVIIGVGAAALTGWHRLDPIIAIAVALNIVRTGVSILRRSLMGLLDTAIPEDLLRQMENVAILVEDESEEGGDGLLGDARAPGSVPTADPTG